MPLRAVFLDTAPLGLATQKSGRSAAGDACDKWVKTLMANGASIYVPGIADYELRRELIRNANISSMARLDLFNRGAPSRYVPITTTAMLCAAELWARLHNNGTPTAAPDAIDGDAILAVQVLTFCLEQGVPQADVVVASANVRHLSRMVASEVWANLSAVTPPL